MIVAQLAPLVTAVRLSLHVLAATVWVGGQLTMAGLVSTARRMNAHTSRRLGQAFSRFSWPAYAVLLATGIWNVAAVSQGQGTAWDAVLGAKIAVAVVSGLAAWLHGHAHTQRGLAIWGATTATTSVAALVMGVVLAG